MSTAVTASSDLRPAAPVRVSTSLSDVLDTVQAIVERDLSPGHLRPSRTDVMEAKAALPRAERQCGPAEHKVVALWMERLRALPFGPRTDAEVAAVVASAIAANGDLPAPVWAPETAVEALRTFKAFPSPAEVREMLVPHARRFWSLRDGLRRVANYRAETAVREPKTDEAREAVSSMVASFIAERAEAHAQTPGAKPKVTPRHLSDGQLLAVYERMAAEGVPGAEIRLAMLRRSVAHTGSTANAADE